MEEFSNFANIFERKYFLVLDRSRVGKCRDYAKLYGAASMRVAEMT